MQFFPPKRLLNCSTFWARIHSNTIHQDIRTLNINKLPSRCRCNEIRVLLISDGVCILTLFVTVCLCVCAHTWVVWFSGLPQSKHEMRLKFAFAQRDYK